MIEDYSSTRVSNLVCLWSPVPNWRQRGAFLGASTVELTASNTDDSDSAPMGSEKINVGAATIGLGYLKSWNKLAMGVFLGWDFGVGDISNTWDYDGRAWLGFGIGYDIFKF